MSKELQNITLYTSTYSPFSHRVCIALEEIGAEYKIIDIDLSNKPAWYAEKVYSAGRIPYLVYGGGELHPGEEPSPEMFGTPESLIILEFLADLDTTHCLLPASPALRAKARLFMNVVETKLTTTFIPAILGRTNLDPLLAALTELEGMLPVEGEFVLGEQWSIADAAVVPLFLRMRAMFKAQPPSMQSGEPARGFAALESPRLKRYLEANLARESVVKTWDEKDVVTKILEGIERVLKAGKA